MSDWPGRLTSSGSEPFDACPDSGRCWHACPGTGEDGQKGKPCWRVLHAAPLSSLGETWPRATYEAHAAMAVATEVAVCIEGEATADGRGIDPSALRPYDGPIPWPSLDVTGPARSDVLTLEWALGYARTYWQHGDEPETQAVLEVLRRHLEPRDHDRHAALLDAVSHAPADLTFEDRRAIAEHLWRLGWRPRDRPTCLAVDLDDDDTEWLIQAARHWPGGRGHVTHELGAALEARRTGG